MNQGLGETELISIQTFLKDCIPFETLSKSELKTLSKQLRITYFRKGLEITESTDNQGSLRIIKSGAIDLLSDKNRLQERIAEKGSFHLHRFKEQNPHGQAICYEDSLIYSLPEKHYQEWCLLYPQIEKYYQYDATNSRTHLSTNKTQGLEDPLQTSVSTLMSTILVSVTPDTSIKQTAKIMRENKISSVIVASTQEKITPPLTGIVTDRDLRNRVVAEGADIHNPINTVMTNSPITIESHTTVFEALIQMLQHNIHHLPVVDKSKHSMGMLTSSDLVFSQQDDPVFLTRKLLKQNSIKDLKKTLLQQDVPKIFHRWSSNNIGSEKICHLISIINDTLLNKLIEITISDIGPAPVNFAWVNFGSQARQEPLLSADQDNGLIISDDIKPEHLNWFETLSTRVCDGLNDCGIPHCPGNIMASNTQWRQPLKQWQTYVKQWTNSSTPEHVMNSSIFFDIRVVYGDHYLGEQLQNSMLKQTQKNSIYLAALADNALSSHPPLGLFRRFIVERNGEHKDQFDLKKRGITPIIDLVRVYSLANGISEINTIERLKALAQNNILSDTDVENLKEAYNGLMSLRIQHQAQQAIEGKIPDNYINPHQLSSLNRQHLKDIFSIIHTSQEALKLRFKQGLS